MERRYLTLRSTIKRQSINRQVVSANCHPQVQVQVSKKQDTNSIIAMGGYEEFSIVVNKLPQSIKRQVQVQTISSKKQDTNSIILIRLGRTEAASLADLGLQSDIDPSASDGSHFLASVNVISSSSS